ncbi:hypothetical protein FRC12_009170 [Ceratobasidium sp. 428]|nr:hypothetical protein FRC12_009170 [Ceratobasidium sp. 428]
MDSAPRTSKRSLPYLSHHPHLCPISSPRRSWLGIGPNSATESGVQGASSNITPANDRTITAEDDETSETETDDELVMSEEDEDELVEALKAAEEEDGDDDLEWKSTDGESDAAEDED